MLERASVEEETYVGREVAGYRLEEIIGRGGMGVVYRAEHVRLGRKAALKVVAPQIAREPKFRERFLRESRTAGSLDHPNVVPLYDAGESDGVLYIAMRFVDGVDLSSLIASEGKLEPARTARIVAQVASALDAAHEAGLVHRDVKPSNVLLPARGAGRGEHAYLGDFGLTKRVLSESGVTGSSAFIGTIAYVAPEQIEGKAVDARADQYSLACLVYECLTGHRPFERETDIATLYAHLRDPFPTVGEAVADPVLRAELDAALARAGSKNPQDRFDSCGDLAEELLRITGATSATSGTGTSTSARPPQRGRGSSRPPFRRILLGVGALLVLVIAGFGAYQLLVGGSGAPVVSGNGVATIDPNTNTATLVTALDHVPTAAVADETAIWIAHFDGDSVTWIDAGTHDMMSIGVGAGPTGLASLVQRDTNGNPDGLVWVTNTTNSTLSKIDASQLGPDPRSTVRTDFRPGALTAGGDFLWVLDAQGDRMVQLDATDGGHTGTEPIATGAGPVAVAVINDSVWVANGLDRSLTRLTIGSLNPDTAISLGFTPMALAADPDGRTLWIVNNGGDEVVRFDTAAREVSGRYTVGPRPVSVVAGAGAVWVADSGDGTISRVDPETGEVISIPVGGAPVAVAISGDLIWVVVSAR